MKTRLKNKKLKLTAVLCTPAVGATCALALGEAADDACRRAHFTVSLQASS